MTTTPFDWDRFSKATNRWKPEKIGDAIAGLVRAIRTTTFGGKVAEADAVPELLLETEDSLLVSVAASQDQLQSALGEQKPQVGDRIAIVFTGERPSSRAGFNPAKLFDVVVRRNVEGDDQGPSVSASDLLGD